MKSLTPSVIFSGAAGRRLEDQSGHIHDHPRDARSTQNRAGYLLSTYRAHRVSKVGEANADRHGSPRPEFGSEPAHADAKKMEKLAVRIRFAGSGWSAIREYWDSVLKDPSRRRRRHPAATAAFAALPAGAASKCVSGIRLSTLSYTRRILLLALRMGSIS